MDKRTLKQYRPLQKEIKLLDKKIDKLYDRQAALPTVLGKVTKSGKDFPYIEEHMSVLMDEPKGADEIAKLLLIREQRRKQAKKMVLGIERFISDIQDSTDRQIFELTFLDGKKQQEVADAVGYSRSRISQIISDYLKD